MGFGVGVWEFRVEGPKAKLVQVLGPRASEGFGVF